MSMFGVRVSDIFDDLRKNTFSNVDMQGDVRDKSTSSTSVHGYLALSELALGLVHGIYLSSMIAFLCHYSLMP